MNVKMSAIVGRFRCHKRERKLDNGLIPVGCKHCPSHNVYSMIIEASALPECVGDTQRYSEVERDRDRDRELERGMRIKK